MASLVAQSILKVAVRAPGPQVANRGRIDRPTPHLAGGGYTESALVESRFIAIVDDDAPLLLALGNLVRSAGHRVVLFENAEACLAGIAGLTVELVLTDYRMSGANGVELMQSLHAAGYGVPVIVMTAQPFAEVAGSAIPGGAFAVLAKPFDEDDLLETLERALSDPGGRASASEP